MDRPIPRPVTQFVMGANHLFLPPYLRLRPLLYNPLSHASLSLFHRFPPPYTKNISLDHRPVAITSLRDFTIPIRRAYFPRKNVSEPATNLGALSDFFFPSMILFSQLFLFPRFPLPSFPCTTLVQARIHTLGLNLRPHDLYSYSVFSYQIESKMM